MCLPTHERPPRRWHLLPRYILYPRRAYHRPAGTLYTRAHANLPYNIKYNNKVGTLYYWYYVQLAYTRIRLILYDYFVIFYFFSYGDKIIIIYDQLGLIPPCGGYIEIVLCSCRFSSPATVRRRVFIHCTLLPYVHIHEYILIRTYVIINNISTRPDLIGVMRFRSWKNYDLWIKLHEPNTIRSV